MKSLKSGFILSYASIAVQSVISVIYTPVMLRLLGQSGYGLLQLASSAIAHLGILSFGFSGSYLRFYSSARAKGDKKAVETLNGMFAMVFIGASLLALLCGAAVTAGADKIFAASVSGGGADTLRLLLGIMTVNLALSLPCSVFDAYITAHERFSFQKILVIVSSLLNPMLTLPLLLTGYGSVSVAVCMTAITLLKLIISGVFCVKRLNMRFRFGIDKVLFKQLCTFSFFVFLNIISDQITWNADKTLLGIFKGSREVTLYALGAQINTYFLTFSYVLSSLFSPRAYRIAAARHSGKLLNRFFARFGRLQMSVMMYIFLLLIAAGRPFLRLWSGIDSDVPYCVTMLLTSPILVTSAQSVGIEIQRAKDMHRFRSVLYIAIALVNVCVSVPMCIYFGAVGCAAVTCGCLVIGNILIMNIYYHRRVGLDMMYFWREILRLLPAFALPCALSVLMSFFVRESLVWVVLSAAALAVVYVPSVWFLGVRGDLIKKK